LCWKGPSRSRPTGVSALLRSFESFSGLLVWWWLECQTI
jgi:hypothetical protein